MSNVESGKVDNKKVTEYKGKTDDGKPLVEKVTKNKDTDEIKREVNGEEMLESEETNKIPNSIRLNTGNFEALLISQLNTIIGELKGIRYYTGYLEKKIDSLSSEKGSDNV